MNIQFFCPRWGSESLPWDDFCARVKAVGYDGVEYAIAHNTPIRELDKAWDAAARHRLFMLPQHFDTVTADFAVHFEAFHHWLERIRPYPAVKINSQTGKDFFSFTQNSQLIELANRYGVYHETHRGKFSFAAHVTEAYLQKIPALRLTLDISHWVCVAESLLDDQPRAVQHALDRTGHIHARVGHPEGPQVSDPRAPEWQETLARHQHWWDQVVRRTLRLALPLTITPEFGPFPYMVHVPGTDVPIASQWDINYFMMQRLRDRYSSEAWLTSSPLLSPTAPRY